ncbi:hypothetical protein [Paracoccus seriniphilus]|uniref:hypothetical protein n=1 Tax=Paracoccus seriniphilus TaxID=184748 RepID=UPI00356483A8
MNLWRLITCPVGHGDILAALAGTDFKTLGRVSRPLDQIATSRPFAFNAPGMPWVARCSAKVRPISTPLHPCA